MAGLPGQRVIYIGLLMTLFVSTSADNYFFPVTGNCTNGSRKVFRVWSSQPRPGSFHCIQYDGMCTDADIPDHLKDPVNFMGKPQSLDVRAYSARIPSIGYRSGINVTWTPPRHESRLTDLKGFMIRLYPVLGTANTACRVFDFSQNNFTSADVSLSFNKELFPVKAWNVVYMVVVTTLPTPKSGNEIHFHRYQGVRPPPPGNGTLGWPIDWSAPLSYDNSTPGEVKVGFGFAPAEFGFERYQLEIVEKDAKKVYKYIIINQNDLSDKTWASWTFTNVFSSTWRVRVQPIDPFFNDYHRCLCFRGINALGNRNCKSCMITQSAEFTTEGSSLPPVLTTATTTRTKRTTATTKTTATTTTTTPSTDFSKSTMNGPVTDIGKITGSIVGTILGVALLAIVGCVLWMKRKSRADTSLKLFHNNNNKPHHRDIYTITPGLATKTVFILNADDHLHHKQVIEQFGVYLQTYCKCDVIYAPWRANEIRAQGNGNLWAITNISRCDYTIIVNSEAAFNLFEAVKGQDQRTMYKNPDASPEGDLFTPSIRYIVSKLGDLESFPKFIMASFEYTKDEHIISEINPGLRYKLPKHLPNLLCHIHKLDTQAITNDLPCSDNIADTLEGKKLEKTIRIAAAFERRNPKWFKDRYMRTDSGFHSTAPDDLQSPSEHHFVDPSLDNFGVTSDTNSAFTYLPSEYAQGDDPGYNFDPFCPDSLEPPEDIGHFESLSMTLSDQLREVNRYSDMDEELGLYPDGFIHLDCQSLGGKSV